MCIYSGKEEAEETDMEIRMVMKEERDMYLIKLKMMGLVGCGWHIYIYEP